MGWKRLKKPYRGRVKGAKFRSNTLFFTAKHTLVTPSLHSVEEAELSSTRLLKHFYQAKSRTQKLKIKRATVSAANKAKAGGLQRVEAVYREAYLQMILKKVLPPFPKNAGVVGFRKDEKGQIQPITKEDGTKRRTYETGHTSCPDLHPAKLAQRKALADRMKKKGTVLEVYAGKGGLTKTVYAKKAEKVVLVDKNPKLLKKADKALRGRVKRELIVADNKAWLKNELPQKQLKNLKLVDFDAFGSPAAQMKIFFDNYEVKKPLLVALTDGSTIYVGYCQNAKGRRWLKQHYGVDVLPGHFGTRNQQVEILNKFMRAQGKKHGFKVEPVSVAHGDVKTVYAGYKITPVRN